MAHPGEKTLFGRRPWREPPIVFQILVLLLGGLVVAQFVTLLLTLVLPPAPPVQHGLGDIVAALRGEAGRSDRLTRAVQAGPPDIGGPGWFTSDESREELARRLGAAPGDVRLAFYAPLPFAGTMLPPMAPGSGVRPVAWTTAPDPLRPRPLDPRTAAVFGLAGYDPDARTTPSVRAGGGRGTGHERPAPPTSLDFARDEREVSPTSPTNAPDTRHTETVRAERSRGTGPKPAFRLAVLDLAAGAPARTGLILVDQPGGGPGGFPGGGGGGGFPREGGFPGGAQSGGFGGERDRGGMTRGGERGGMRGEGGRGTGAGDLLRQDQGQFGRAPSPADLARQPIAPGARDFDDARGFGDFGDRMNLPGDRLQPLPIAPQGHALFGLAPAPFVEGDFVAAMRLPGGRWAVVQPAAQAFPNPWQTRVMLWFAIAFALVAPIGWVYARHIVRPLARFTQAAEALGRDPSAALVALEGPAEIGRAAHAFNVMQNRLRAFVDDRTAMVGAISHDLRTPLTRLRFRIEEVDDEHVREGMTGEVEEMEAMIASVLGFIRDASTPNVRERLDLGILVEDVVQDAALIGGDVRVEAMAAAPVEVDVLGVRRLLTNLVENAVKYGERARIRLAIEDDAAVAEIRDDGPGVPEDELERAFEPFYRASNAAVSGKEGTGLGLAVCRSIARSHGGDVTLVRSSEGFAAQLRLPLAYDSVRAAA